MRLRCSASWGATATSGPATNSTGAAVTAARDPDLYGVLGVPDTLDGRFDLIGLHAFLLIRRLRALPPPGPALAQAVFDAMFSDMDINLREMGVGDLSVGKQGARDVGGVPRPRRRLPGGDRRRRSGGAGGSVGAQRLARRGRPARRRRRWPARRWRRMGLSRARISALGRGRSRGSCRPRRHWRDARNSIGRCRPDRIGEAGYRARRGGHPRPSARRWRARLGVPAVTALACRFRLTRIAGAILAEGRLDALVSRVCVATLDEFEVPVTEEFRVRFVPAGSESNELDLDAEDEIPYRGGLIDLGEAAVEQLALALDPYPRKPDALA